ncbi:hypothetical protein NAF17_05885 [Mucilaginibacter sp. RB4R14]|uniref:hypothetical protein n=1 Tax=Mucilaginibacter aurantiaciroseus TaxID=2949308 RepID=UPI00209080B4|nr:hypothetical protein [Mucilaginibacter aurantiaciroseus]MCO5935060.1 hypothetical protein [Mucilaginibacter aurantiaciroseus]
MKLSFSIALILISYNINGFAQKAIVNGISINGVTLCKTKIKDLKEKYIDVKELAIGEMDLQKNCFGQDSRFIAGKGFSFEKLPEMIFQTSQTSGLVSKIRLTKLYTGVLPDGKTIDMSKLVLGDVIKLYPQFKNKWKSRDCSGYWNFSNDTISFYVKIDKAKQPQFPIDKAYYMNKPIEGIDIISSCYDQENNKDFDVSVIPADPIFYVDSVKVLKADLMKYNPDDIVMLTVYKDANAIELGGPEAKYGLIYIETKQFAKKRYWNFFSSKSAEYTKVVPSATEDANVQYILNKRVLTKSYEGDLASINDKTFKEIRIISKNDLFKNFGVKDKAYGIIIISDAPPNLKNGKD